jgi:hypothetical protein
MTNFFILLFFHHLADVSLQPTWLIDNKKKHWFSIYEHCFVWSGVIGLTLYYLGIFSWWKVVFLFVGHFLIDLFKYRFTKNYNWVYLDQILHYLQICLVL